MQSQKEQMQRQIQSQQKQIKIQQEQIVTLQKEMAEIRKSNNSNIWNDVMMNRKKCMKLLFLIYLFIFLIIIF